MTLQDDGYCFACGKENPAGLHLSFDYKDEEAVASFLSKKEHQGWNDIIHGGILTTLIDEAMAKVLMFQDIFAVTSNLEVRFLRPVHVGENVIVSGQVKKIDGRRIYLSAKILNNQGKIAVSGKAVYVKPL